MAIFDSLSPEYRLYLESMLPWMNEKPIGKEYFTDAMIDQLQRQVASEHERTGETSGLITEVGGETVPSYFFDAEGNPLEEEKRVGPDLEPGTMAHASVMGDPMTLWNTLGSYRYNINRPSAPAFDPATIDITDRYNWNPEYDQYGWSMDREKRGDVTTPMMLKGIYNTFGSGPNFLGNTIEMLGNYMGHRESEGKGRDVNINIPFVKGESKSKPSLGGTTIPPLKTPMLNMVKNMARTRSRVDPSGRPKAYGLNRGGLMSLT